MALFSGVRWSQVTSKLGRGGSNLSRGGATLAVGAPRSLSARWKLHCVPWAKLLSAQVAGNMSFHAPGCWLLTGHDQPAPGSASQAPHGRPVGHAQPLPSPAPWPPLHLARPGRPARHHATDATVQNGVRVGVVVEDLRFFRLGWVPQPGRNSSSSKRRRSNKNSRRLLTRSGRTF